MDELEQLRRQSMEAFAAGNIQEMERIEVEIATLRMGQKANQRGQQAAQDFQRQSTSFPVRLGATAILESARIGGDTVD